MTLKTGCAGIFVGVLVSAAACDRASYMAIAPGTAEPPDSITNPLAAEQRAAVLQYVRERLKFDSLPHGAGDRQRLTRRDPATRREVLGPIAKILPERHARGNTGPALERGRIVGQITTDGPYATLGLPAGVSYLWIDSLRPTDSLGRAIVIPADSSVPARRVDVYYVRDPHAAHGREPAARWIYAEGRSEFAWLTCATNGCCVVGVRSAEEIAW